MNDLWQIELPVDELGALGRGYLERELGFKLWSLRATEPSTVGHRLFDVGDRALALRVVRSTLSSDQRVTYSIRCTVPDDRPSFETMLRALSLRSRCESIASGILSAMEGPGPKESDVRAARERLKLEWQVQALRRDRFGVRLAASEPFWVSARGLDEARLNEAMAEIEAELRIAAELRGADVALAHSGDANVEAWEVRRTLRRWPARPRVVISIAISGVGAVVGLLELFDVVHLF